MANFTTVWSNLGSYDILHPNAKQGLYKFIWRDDAPEHIKKGASSFTVQGERFTGAKDPLDAIEEIIEDAKHAWFRDKAQLPVIQQYLESIADSDHVNRLLDRREKLRQELAELDVRLERLGAGPVSAS